MRVIARRHLDAYAAKHPTAKPALLRWIELTKAADWGATSDVQASFANAKIINSERVRFEVAHNQHRLIAAFDFERKIAFIKFLGAHAEYDRIDAATVSMF